MQNFAVHQGTGKVIFHAPHGGLLVPSQERSLFLLNDDALKKEHLNMVDRYTDSITQAVREGTDASSLINLVSRLVCDPERFIGDEEEMESVGMGFAYTHGYAKNLIRNLSVKEKMRIRKTYYDPYAEKLADLVNVTLAKQGEAFILDIHSYASQALPYELHQNDDRPEICLGFNEYHLNKKLLQNVADILSEKYTVGFNSPFSGSYVPLEHYEKNTRVSSLMLEIRRDTYMDELSGELHKGADDLIQLLREVYKMVAR